MNVHEYQAKALFREYGVAVPEGELATTPAEAEEAAKRLGTAVTVVKAQIHAGGRGKGGGVKLAKSPAEAKQHAIEILGMALATQQTGPEGKLVRKVYVEDGSDIARELYLGIVLDRSEEKLAVIASTEGGASSPITWIPDDGVQIGSPARSSGVSQPPPQMMTSLASLPSKYLPAYSPPVKERTASATMLRSRPACAIRRSSGTSSSAAP